MKTVKTLAAAAAIATSAAVANATTIAVKNFDEDLATVYVDDEATTNGQVVAVGESVKIGSDFYIYLSDVKAPRYSDYAYYSGLATLKGPADRLLRP